MLVLLPASIGLVLTVELNFSEVWLASSTKQVQRLVSSSQSSGLWLTRQQNNSSTIVDSTVVPLLYIYFLHYLTPGFLTQVESWLFTSSTGIVRTGNQDSYLCLLHDRLTVWLFSVAGFTWQEGCVLSCVVFICGSRNSHCLVLH